MDSQQFANSLQLIFETTENEMDCDQLQSFLADYVDLELKGLDPAKQFPALQAHLLQCPACAEDYSGLVEIARLEAHDRLPLANQILKQFPPDTEAVSKGTDAVPELRSDFVPVTGR